MKIFIKVKTGAKIDKVEEIDKTHFKVFVKVRPIRGQANKEVIKLMAKYFKLTQSEVEIISGVSSKNKTLEVE